MRCLISTSDGFYGMISSTFFRVISGIIFGTKISSIFYHFPIIQGIIFCVIRSRSFRSMISGSISFKWFCSMDSKSLCSSGFKGSCSIRFKSFISKNFKSFCSMISFSMIFKSFYSICFKNFFNMIFRMF